MPAQLPSFTVIIDSREKCSWSFDAEEKKPGKVKIDGSVIECLDAGDYSIKGLEHIIRIEKKAGFQEMFGNMIPISNKERFHREMEKLKDIPHKYLLIETSLSDDILGLSISQFSHGPTANKVLEWITELSHLYGIMPIFVGECGEKVAKHILRSIARRYLYDNAK